MVDRVSSPLPAALEDRVVVADGAMGTMLQSEALTLDDFAGHEGCNEILNVTRPDIVRGVHRACLEAGADAVETNTFGANLPNLADHGIEDRIFELSRVGGAPAREVADEFAEPVRPRFVLGSVGPGTKPPTLDHAPYVEQVKGLLAGGVDAVVVETSQDLLQAKASIVGAKRAMAADGRVVPIIAQVTVETTGTMLFGSEIGAALTALEPLGIDLIGLTCATGPAEMSEHLRQLARQSRVPLSVMPDAGLPQVGPNGARLVGGCCGSRSRASASTGGCASRTSGASVPRPGLGRGPGGRRAVLRARLPRGLLLVRLRGVP